MRRSILGSHQHGGNHFEWGVLALSLISSTMAPTRSGVGGMHEQ
jgi:hypothetical protein